MCWLWALLFALAAEFSTGTWLWRALGFAVVFGLLAIADAIRAAAKKAGK